MANKIRKNNAPSLCKICGEKYVKEIPKDGRSICYNCEQDIKACEVCGAEMQKYDIARATEKRTCSRHCRSIIIANAPGWREKHSEDMKRIHLENPEYSEMVVRAMADNFYKIRTPEARKRKSELSRERMSRPEVREYYSKLSLERWQDEEWRQNTVAAIRQAAQSDDFRRKSGMASIKRWSDPQYASRMMIAFKDRIGLGIMSSIEKLVDSELKSRGIIGKHNLHVGRWFIDIALIEEGIAIECDGTYWHRNRKDKDAQKDEYLSGHGWTVIRLSEYEILDNVRNAIEEKVMPFLNGTS